MMSTNIKRSIDRLSGEVTLSIKHWWTAGRHNQLQSEELALQHPSDRSHTDVLRRKPSSGQIPPFLPPHLLHLQIIAADPVGYSTILLHRNILTLFFSTPPSLTSSEHHCPAHHCHFETLLMVLCRPYLRNHEVSMQRQANLS